MNIFFCVYSVNNRASVVAVDCSCSVCLGSIEDPRIQNVFVEHPEEDDDEIVAPIYLYSRVKLLRLLLVLLSLLLLLLLLYTLVRL